MQILLETCNADRALLEASYAPQEAWARFAEKNKDRLGMAFANGGWMRGIVDPLATGISARVGKLRAAGNAIVPQAAAEFIRATDGRW